MFLYCINLIAAVIGVVFMASPLQCFILSIFINLDAVWHCGKTALGCDTVYEVT